MVDGSYPYSTSNVRIIVFRNTFNSFEIRPDHGDERGTAQCGSSPSRGDYRRPATTHRSTRAAGNISIFIFLLHEEYSRIFMHIVQGKWPIKLMRGGASAKSRF